MKGSASGLGAASKAESALGAGRTSGIERWHERCEIRRMHMKTPAIPQRLPAHTDTRRTSRSAFALVAMAMALAASACGVQVSGGGGDEDQRTSGSESFDYDDATEVRVGWEDVSGLDCSGIAPQLHAEILQATIVVDCAPGQEDQLVAGTVDVLYHAQCTTEPAYVVLEAAEIQVWNPDGTYPIGTFPLNSPIVPPGGSATGTFGYSPAAVPGICQTCDNPPSVRLAWRRSASDIAGIVATAAIQCLP